MVDLPEPREPQRKALLAGKELTSAVNHHLFLILHSKEFIYGSGIGHLGRFKVAGEGMSPLVGCIAARPVKR